MVKVKQDKKSKKRAFLEESRSLCQRCRGQVEGHAVAGLGAARPPRLTLTMSILIVKVTCGGREGAGVRKDLE